MHWLLICQLQPSKSLLTNSSLELYSSRFNPTCLRLEAWCRCRPHSQSLPPPRSAERGSSTAAATMTRECEDGMYSPLLVSKQHLWLPMSPSPSRDRTAAQSLRPLLNPQVFWVELEHLKTCLPRINMQQPVLKRVSLQPARSHCPPSPSTTVPLVGEEIAEHIEVRSPGICRSCLDASKPPPWAPASFSCGKSCAKSAGRIVMDLN